MKTFPFLILLLASSCWAKDNYTVMLARGKSIFMVPFDASIYEDYKDKILLDAKDVRDFDIDFDTGLVFWYDRTDKKIYFNLMLSNNKNSLIKDQTIGEVGGLAVDWVYKHIYWTDVKKNTIEIANFKGDMHLVLSIDGIEAPRAIALDPTRGLMFWIASTKRRIVKTAMDGYSSKVLFYNENIVLSALALDLHDSKVYWVDGEEKRMCWSDYQGQQGGRRWRSAALQQPSSICILDDEIYWSDNKKPMVMKAHKDGVLQTTLTEETNITFGDLRIYHPSTQPDSINYCDGENRGRYCSHLCAPATNKGSICVCPQKFTMQRNGFTCIKNELIDRYSADIPLMFAQEHDIRKISLSNLEMSIMVKQTNFARALDFHLSQKRIYWSDWTDKKMYSAPFDRPYEKKIVIADGAPVIYSLAIDWIYNHIYWTNFMEGNIEFSNLKGDWRKVLFEDGMNTKCAIALNPLEGWMFWTDVRNRKIEKAGMDGSERTILVSTDILEPSGLALDLKAERLYWSDIEQKAIYTVRYSGIDRKTYLGKLEYSPHSIVVFQDSVYWATRDLIAIFQVEKLNKSITPITPLYFQSLRPGGLKVYHESNQPKGTNYCQSINKLCSHFCLPAPKEENSSPKVTCACPDGFRMKTDQLSCVKDVLSPQCDRPYVVEVQIHNSKSKDDKKHCTGTILHERWILTAASCVIYAGGERFIKINANIRATDDEDAVFWNVIKLVLHPKFEPTKNSTFKHDVAMLKISQRIKEKTLIHELNFDKWLTNSSSLSKNSFTTPTTYCEDQVKLGDALLTVCATTRTMPAEITPLLCRGAPILQHGIQIGLLSVAHHTDSDRSTVFNTDEDKAFFLKCLQNKHRRFIVARPFRSSSPEKSRVVKVKSPQ